MLFLRRRPALSARFSAFIAQLPRFRLGITGTLTIAFLTVGVLAAAANLISERGMEITRMVVPDAPPVIQRVSPPLKVVTTHADTPAVISIDTLLAAETRFEQALQNRVLAQNDTATAELAKAVAALRAETNTLLRETLNRSDSKDRRKLIGEADRYQSVGTQRVKAADQQRQLLTDYASHYEAMHARARASIDGAWKVFGRVVARQVLITLNSQVEDLGRHPASLIVTSDDADEVAETIAAGEHAILRTLLENEHGLVSSQGKAWLDQMNDDMSWLIALRQQLQQTHSAWRASRDAMTGARSSLENAARSIVVFKPAPLVEIPQTNVPTEPQIAPQASPVTAQQPQTISTTVDRDVQRTSTIAWISGGVLLLLVVICVMTVRSVVGPVRRLVRATIRIAAGESNVRVSAGGIKELNMLSVAFNDMAERLDQAERITRDYQAELEQRVHERTEQLNSLASRDTLTTLPNRREMLAFLDAALVRAATERTLVGVFFIDIDNFKNVNDGMGHAFGDQVLQAVAARLQSIAESFGFAARLGGDEFTVIVTNADSVEYIHAAGVQLVNAFHTPLSLSNRQLVISVSVGASVFPNHEQDASALLQAADAALFRAKALGRSQLNMFSADLLEAASAKFAIEQGLRRALDRGEFALVFQPEINLTTMQVELVEALIRWRQPDGRLASPGEFLSVAEESGLIIDISDWVLRTAISTAAQWHHGSWPEARVAINVSSRQLIDGNFVERVISLLEEFRLPARCIEIELTESVLQTGPVTLKALWQLRTQGIAIALDDFGTGYSSLSSLQQLPLTRIKLDRSLLDDIDKSSRSLSIARSIIALSRGLGFDITAEGIERAEQLALLLGEGNLFVQGYLLSRPLAGPDVLNALSTVAQRSQELLLPMPSSMHPTQSASASVVISETAVSIEQLG